MKPSIWPGYTPWAEALPFTQTGFIQLADGRILHVRIYITKKARRSILGR